MFHPPRSILRPEMAVGRNRNVGEKPLPKLRLEHLPKPDQSPLRNAVHLVFYETAKQLSIQLTGKLNPCSGCSKAKGKLKSVPKTTAYRSDRLMQEVDVDLAAPRY